MDDLRSAIYSRRPPSGPLPSIPERPRTDHGGESPAARPDAGRSSLGVATARRARLRPFRVRLGRLRRGLLPIQAPVRAGGHTHASTVIAPSGRRPGTRGPDPVGGRPPRP